LPLAERVVDDRRVRSPERARQHALALRAMRQAMSAGGARGTSGRPAPALAARVVIGGLRDGSNGFMPGVLEETLYALEAGSPVYLVGGFGGGAAVLADALFGDRAVPELAAEYHRRKSDRFNQLEEGLRKHGEQPLLDDLFARLAAAVGRARQDPAAALANGLDADQNRRLARTDHVAEIVSLLRLGLSRRFSQGGRA
jgi:hypothetical protein